MIYIVRTSNQLATSKTVRCSNGQATSAKLPQLILFLLAATTGMYLTQLTISPVYFGFISAVTLFLFYQVSALPRKFSVKSVAPAALLMLVAVSISLWSFLVNDSQPRVLFNLAIGPCLFFILLMISAELTASQLNKAAVISWYSTIVLSFLDTGFRFINPDFTQDTDENRFYGFKYNSIMYEDSNPLGLQLALTFGFMLAARRLSLTFNWYQIALTAILTVLTLSRASIIATLTATFLWLILTSRGYFRVILGVAAAGLCGAVFFGFILGNSSYLSRLHIAGRVAEYLSNAPLMMLLFGVGPGNAADLIGIGGHNIAGTYLFETGIFYSVVVVFVLALFVRRAPEALLIVSVFIINGVVLTSYAVPYLYFYLAIIYTLKRKSHLGLLRVPHKPWKHVVSKQGDASPQVT